MSRGRAIAVCAVLAAGALAVPADGAPRARRRGRADVAGITVRYPSGDVPDAATLNAALQDPTVGTVVFERGTNPFSVPVTVFRREGLTLRGATGRPQDTVLESTSSVALLLDECRGVTIRDLTIRSTAANGEAVRLQAVRSSTVEGFVEDVSLRNARFEGYVGVRGTVRARALDVAGCRIDVTRSGGAGILWEDGPDLLVTRTTFTTSAPASCTGAIVVRGAFVPESEGDRVAGLVLTRNRVDGDFITAFDLSDLVDARISRNRVTYGTATYDGSAGRAGIVVRRASAAAQTEDFEIRRNVVKGAHTAVWALSTGAGVIAGNDLRGSGDTAVDTRFGDAGCAIRIGLFGPICNLRVEGNDMRKLRTSAPDPAAIVLPSENAGLCFPEGTANRVDRGRAVFE